RRRGAQPRAARGVPLRVRLPGRRARAPRATAGRRAAGFGRAGRRRRAALMLELAFMQRAVVAAAAIGLVCGALGFFVVLRRLAFIGVGIAHSAIGGVALAIVLGGPPLASAALFAIAVALAIARLTRSGRLSEDAVIGIF